MKLTKELVAIMRDEMKETLKVLAEKYGCEVGVGNCKYTDVTATFSIDLNLKGDAGLSAEQNLFNAHCKSYGFTPEDYNKCVVLNEKIYNLVGFNIRARKNFCILNKDGASFVTTPEMVKKGIKR